MRKLGRLDRLLGPANLAREHGIPNDNLMRGIAAAFLYDVEDDQQSVELQDKVKQLGIGEVVPEITGYAEGSEGHVQVVQAYNDLKRQHY